MARYGYTVSRHGHGDVEIWMYLPRRIALRVLSRLRADTRQGVRSKPLISGGVPPPINGDQHSESREETTT